MEKNIEMITQKIKEAELVLVGIGEKFELKENEEKLNTAYINLKKLLEGKNYFVITTCVDGLIFHAGLRPDRIACPLAEESEEEKEKESTLQSAWETYMKWLQGTLHKKLLVLELGVGLKYPSVIRFPFEKTVYFNQSADFIRVHDKLFQLPAELNGRGNSVKADAVELLANMEI